MRTKKQSREYMREYRRRRETIDGLGSRSLKGVDRLLLALIIILSAVTVFLMLIFPICLHGGDCTLGSPTNKVGVLFLIGFILIGFILLCHEVKKAIWRN